MKGWDKELCMVRINNSSSITKQSEHFHFRCTFDVSLDLYPSVISICPYFPCTSYHMYCILKAGPL